MTVDTVPKTYERLLSILQRLPPEDLRIVERFVEFLDEEARQDRATGIAREGGRPPYLYPTIAVPADSLDAWMNLLPEGYEGDALADTEDLYDEV